MRKNKFQGVGYNVQQLVKATVARSVREFISLESRLTQSPGLGRFSSVAVHDFCTLGDELCKVEEKACNFKQELMCCFQY